MQYFEEINMLRQQRGDLWRSEAYAECVPVAEDTVKLHIRNENIESIEYADDTFWMGRVYAQVGRLEEARTWFEASVPLTARRYDASALLTVRLREQGTLLADRMTSLGVCYSRMGIHAKAVLTFREVVTVRRHVLGVAHIDTADSLYNLGNACLDAGQLDEAIQYHEEALALRKNDDYAAADSLFCLSHVYQKQQNFERAEAEARKALRLRKRAISDATHEYVVELLQYAQLCDSGEMYDRAADAFGAAGRLIKKLYTEDHLHYAIALNAQAEALAKRGETGRALFNCNKAVRLIRRNLGDYHMICARVLRNLAFLHNQDGHGDRAEKAMSDSLRIRAKLVGVTQMDYSRDVLWLCGLLIEQGNYDRAQVLLQNTLATAREQGDESVLSQMEELFKVYLTLCEMNCTQTEEGRRESERLTAFLKQVFGGGDEA